MRGRAKSHPLANRRIRTQYNRGDGVAVNPFAQARIRPHSEIPRLPNPTSRQHIARPGNFRAEELQKEDPPRTEKIAARSRSEKHEPDNLPQHTPKLAGERMAVLVILKLKLIH